MKILAIDTSCDDTGISIIKSNSGFEILSNIVSSQVKVHQKWGGVYPTLAKREHQRNLVPVLLQALKGAKLLEKTQKGAKLLEKTKLKALKKIFEKEEILYKKLRKFLKNYQEPEIDAIAVTIGPGLEPCLWVGVNFAKAIALFWNLPIIPVNHIEAHILANFTGEVKSLLPAICLVVSGGHTQLILMNPYTKRAQLKIGAKRSAHYGVGVKDFVFKIIGETRDDAAGECFDKTARVLGLEYPGGPAIAALAAIKLKIKSPKLKIGLPRPMIHQKNYDFSFSGLKTAVLYSYQKENIKTRKSKKYLQEMAAEIQQAIIDVLIHKTLKAAKDYEVKSIILGGGVVANNELRKQFAKKIKKEMPNIKYLIPDIKYCTDNAAMIGITAHFNKNKRSKRKIEADANLRI